MTHTPPLFGLVLAGGQSTRMRKDKAVLDYHGKPQLQWAFELLSSICTKTFVSVRSEQRAEPNRVQFPQIVDTAIGGGPMAGIAAAQSSHPEAAWLIVACDLPFVTATTLRNLIERRDPSRIATAYRSAHDGLPEPLCAIWEPSSRDPVTQWIGAGRNCPRKLLINSEIRLVDPLDPKSLDNVNTPDEFAEASKAVVRPAVRKQLRVQYYALFREQAGRSEESLDTTASTAAALYDELKARHGFKLGLEELKVAINAEFRNWDAVLQSGDTVVFIPPVAGG